MTKRGEKMIIYAVDDEALMLEMLCEAITEASEGSELKAFRFSSQLLDAAREKMCDVAFLDVEMPGMDGIELAKQLKELNREVNIIFVTGYAQYAIEALKLYASGFVMKPVSADAIRRELENLRFEVKPEKTIYAKTFGNFTLFRNNEPVHFRLAKSRELLAYLIDRNGSFVSRRELAAVLFENGVFSRTEQSNLCNIISGLETDLRAVDAENIFERDRNGCRVKTDEISCDMYDFLCGKTELFHGEYMEQYSWGEEFKGRVMT